MSTTAIFQEFEMFATSGSCFLSKQDQIEFVTRAFFARSVRAHYLDCTCAIANHYFHFFFMWIFPSLVTFALAINGQINLIFGNMNVKLLPFYRFERWETISFHYDIIDRNWMKIMQKFFLRLEIKRHFGIYKKNRRKR